jgi:deferrochelatase/peroxidase EfeB
VLTDVNIHRIIRRSTTYGAPYDANALSERDDEVPRGIYFLFISAKAMATMEFLQREWINSGNFTGLGEERDPLVGLQEGDATFTIPKGSSEAAYPRHPVVQRATRRRVHVHAKPVGAEVVGRSQSMMRGGFALKRTN